MKAIMTANLILFILLVPISAHADNEWFSWDDTNTTLHVPLTLLMMTDLGQTLYIASSQEYREANKYLGEYPSKEDVYIYFGSVYALTSLITWALPGKWSHAFQGSIITLEAKITEDNHSLGIGVKF